MLLPVVLGGLTLVLSGGIAVVGLAGFFFPLHMITAVIWETATGQSVEQSSRWFFGVAATTTLSLSIGVSAWVAAHAWEDWRRTGVFVATGVAAHAVAGLVVRLRRG